MFQCNSSLRHLADLGIVGNDDQCRPVLMQLLENIEDDILIRLIQVTGGLVRQDDLRVIDQRSRDADALLLAARELAGTVR